MTPRLAILALLALVAAEQGPVRRRRTPADTAQRRTWPAVVEAPRRDSTRYTLRRLPADTAAQWTLRRFDPCVPADAASHPASPLPFCERAHDRR